MDFSVGYIAKKQKKMKQFYGGNFGLHPNSLLIIRLPDSLMLRVISRSLLLAMVLSGLCFFRFINLRGGTSSSSNPIVSESELINLELVELLFHDLKDEGLVKKGHRTLIVSPVLGIQNMNPNPQFLNEYEVDLVLDSDKKRKIASPDGIYDFVLMSSSGDARFIDQVLKINGIVALSLNDDASDVFKMQPNYKIVYLRKYTSTIVALRKTGPTINLSEGSSTRRKLCQLAEETKKKVALKDLEDVFLEPPRRSLAKSKEYLKKIKYLPELLGDSLEAYKRQVFIGIGSPQENSGTVKWFQENYPKKDKEFEVYNVDIEPDEAPNLVDVSDWLRNHVTEEDYVVMKAEADVIERMMKKGAVYLVDELFLECRNEWYWEPGKRSEGRRAYWQCLALYGKLKDEGVAVHQWWG